MRWNYSFELWRMLLSLYFCDVSSPVCEYFTIFQPSIERITNANAAHGKQQNRQSFQIEMCRI
jgi:hypothetical protein